MTDPKTSGIGAILERLPHRYPFLLADRVLEIHPGHSIRALKNVTYNEQFFSGHFPDRPVMPGVILIEALAQVAGILWLMSPDGPRDEATCMKLEGLEKARFRRPVWPEDQLLLSARSGHGTHPMARFSAAAFVGDDQVADAEITLTRQTTDV